MGAPRARSTVLCTEGGRMSFRAFPFSIYLICFIGMSVCLFVWLWPHAWRVHLEARRGHWIPGDWRYRCLLATAWGQGTESRSSARAACALDWWVTSQILRTGECSPSPLFFWIVGEEQSIAWLPGWLFACLSLLTADAKLPPRVDPCVCDSPQTSSIIPIREAAHISYANELFTSSPWSRALTQHQVSVPKKTAELSSCLCYLPIKYNRMN